MKPVEYLFSLPEYKKWRDAIGDYNAIKDYSGAEKSWSNTSFRLLCGALIATLLFMCTMLIMQ